MWTCAKVFTAALKVSERILRLLKPSGQKHKISFYNTRNKKMEHRKPKRYSTSHNVTRSIPSLRPLLHVISNLPPHCCLINKDKSCNKKKKEKKYKIMNGNTATEVR